MLARLLVLLWRFDDWDRWLSHWLALPQEPATRGLRLWSAGVHFVAHLGDSWLWLTVCGFMLAGSRRGSPTQGRKLFSAASSLLVTIVTTAALSAGIKQLVRRKRPRTATFLYGGGVDVHSFPSGHAARLAAIAVWLGAVAPGWSWQMWTLTWLVGFSRVHLGIHYAGDVMAGCAAGGFAAWIIRRVWRNKTAHQP